jgi:nucleotide-binding universal stress UspA family protein
LTAPIPRLLKGSVAEQVVQHATVPVVVLLAPWQ